MVGPSTNTWVPIGLFCNLDSIVQRLKTDIQTHSTLDAIFLVWVQQGLQKQPNSAVLANRFQRVDFLQTAD